VTGASLRRFEVFAALDDAELQAVAGLLQARELTPEQRLWREGDPSDGLWLLDEGVVRFETRGEGPLGQRAAPACFGCASLVGAPQREASAHAEGRAHAWLLSKTAFDELVERAPRAAARVVAAIAAELAAVLHEGVGFLAERR
jgi:CRP-like cAMP-binding protein